MILFGIFYDQLRSASQIEAAFAGMNPAVVAVVAKVAWDLSKNSRRSWQIALMVGSFVAVEVGVGVFEIVLVTTLSGFGYCVFRGMLKSKPPIAAISPLPLMLFPNVALLFIRMGASSFGGGLALIPILDHQVVDALHWLTPREFSDAVTLGQITPGPVAITATFVGYRIAGISGALLATVATFTPAFIGSVTIGRSLQAFHTSPVTRSILDLLKPVIVGVVAAAALSLGRSTLHGRLDFGMAMGSFVALHFVGLPTLVVLLCAALLRAIPLLFQ